MNAEELSRSIAAEVDRRVRIQEDIQGMLWTKQRMYLRDVIERVLQENGLALPSSEWMEQVLDSFMAKL